MMLPNMLSARGSSGSRNGSRSTSRARSREREIPKASELVEFNYAVAGHAGTMCDADGELFIKPCKQAELDFYESAQAAHKEFAEWMPLYYGALSLNENSDMSQIQAQIPALVQQADVPASVKHHVQSHLVTEEAPLRIQPVVAGLDPLEEPVTPAVDNITWVPNHDKKISTDRAVVLENAAYGFKQPNIMDCKLGVRLWADDAPMQKRQRFDKIASETTHKNFGFRIAGMRTYKGSSDPKEWDREDYKKYDKNWGRDVVNDENLPSMIKKFIFNETAGIDEELGQFVAAQFAEDLRRVQFMLENEESRMYSSSLLFVVEGDGPALREAINDARTRMNRAYDSKINGHANGRVDSGIGMEEDDEPTEIKVVLEDQGDLHFDDEDDEDDDEEESTFPQIYSLKLIDFAHAQWVPGQGPDENILLGVRSLRTLFEDMSR